MRFSREEILDVATTVIDTQGIGVSTAKIVAAAGVSNGSLFHYFPTKQALLDALYLYLKADLSAALGELDQTSSPRERAALIWQRWCRWARAHPERHRVARLLHAAELVDPEALGEAAALFAPINAVFDDARASGDLVDMPLDYLAATIQAHLELAIDSDLTPAQQATAFAMAWASITTH